MKLWRAVVAGLVGCVVVIAAMTIAGAMSGTDADLCALTGAVITGRTGAMSWLVGCLAQVVVAIIAALVYAVVFEWIVRRAGALVGLAIAVPHAMIAGIVIGFLPVSGMMNAGIAAPGAFLEYRGWAAIVTFVFAHLVFGAIVGALYGTTLHRVPSARPTWRDVTIESPDAVQRIV
jgi:hypothetical protein